MAKTVKFAALAAIAGLALAACGGSGSDAKTLVIATDLPLQGSAKDSNDSTNQALALYLEQIDEDANTAGVQFAGYTLELKYYDNATAAKGSWDGRFAVKVIGLTEAQNQGGSGGFTLTQDALIDTLEIRNPMGGSIAKIIIRPGEAILESDGKLVTAVDADTLVQNTLGLPLPARGLSNWLRGEVRAGSEASVDRNSKGQVNKISQDGWDLVYTWSNTNRLEKLTMTRSSNIGSIDIRLVFDRPND